MMVTLALGIAYVLLGAAMALLFRSSQKPYFWIFLALGQVAFAVADYLDHKHLITQIADIVAAVGFGALYGYSAMKQRATGKRRKVEHNNDTQQVSLRELMHLNKIKEDGDG